MLVPDDDEAENVLILPYHTFGAELLMFAAWGGVAMLKTTSMLNHPRPFRRIVLL